jgi:uncharacterized protein (DUF433 family)/predicted HTH domain antitoxin
VETTLDLWQLQQLERLLRSEPDRVERAMQVLWRAEPDLFRDVTIGAVDQDALTLDEAARALGVSQDEAERMLVDFRARQQNTAGVIEHKGEVAYLAGTHVSVWEIVREYRKADSVEQLYDSFPTLTRGLLMSALRYAERHPEEIDKQIAHYEAHLAKKRSEYPFAG